MKHFTGQQWLNYVKNEVSDDVRQSYEDHLYICDHCLELYLQAVAEYETELPDISEGAGFADRVMAEVTKLPSAEEPVEKYGKMQPFYKTVVFHYTLAGAMTLLFMFSGVFEAITQYAGMIQTPVPSEEKGKPSVTEELVDKTFAWIDSFDRKNEEADK